MLRPAASKLLMRLSLFLTGPQSKWLLLAFLNQNWEPPHPQLGHIAEKTHDCCSSVARRFFTHNLKCVFGVWCASLSLLGFWSS